MPKWKLKIAIPLQVIPLLMMLITAAESCNVTFTATGPVNRRSGTITSINFPRPYPAGVNCEFHFVNSRETRLQLTFTDFDLRDAVPDTDGQCAFDFVDIFLVDGTNSPMKMLGRKCGNTQPQQLSTSALHVTVYFKSRSTVNDQYSGFRAEFSFTNDSALLSPSQLDSVEDSLCGVTRLRGTGGTLMAPTLSSSRDMQAKQRQMLLSTGMINCTWTIRITEGDQILVNFISLNLGPSEVVCRDSYLLLYNSVTDLERTGSVEKICGRLSLFPGKTKEYVSNGPWLTIRYIYKLPKFAQLSSKSETEPTAPSHSQTDYDSTLAPTMASALSYDPNFRLVWTAIWNSKQGIECPGFECTGRQTCLDPGRVVCHKTPRYCIHPTLRCDGIPHCGPSDTSDEENCQLPLILSGVAAGVGVLLTLVAAVALIVWRIRMPKHRRTKAKPFGRPVTRAAKAGAPPHLGRMFEHLAEKKSVTTEYTAVITNQRLVNTRSILAALSQENNSKTAAGSSSSDPSPNTQKRPVALKPSIIVNRQAGLVSVRFAAATPPESASPDEQRQKQIPPHHPQSEKQPEKEPEEREEKQQDQVGLPLLSPVEQNQKQIVITPVEEKEVPPSGALLATSVSAYENPLEKLVAEKVPMNKSQSSEEESGSISFPPPPTSDEIVQISTTSPSAVTPPSLAPLSLVVNRRTSTTSSSSGNEDEGNSKRQIGTSVAGVNRRPRMPAKKQSHGKNGSAPLDLSLEKSSAGIEAKAIAKLLRENAPEHRHSAQLHHSHASKSPHKARHQHHEKTTGDRSGPSTATTSVQSPPESNIIASASTEFQWELRTPSRGVLHKPIGSHHQAQTLPHYYVNVRPTPPSPPATHTPDSLATESPKVPPLARPSSHHRAPPPSDRSAAITHRNNSLKNNSKPSEHNNNSDQPSQSLQTTV